MPLLRGSDINKNLFPDPRLNKAVYYDLLTHEAIDPVCHGVKDLRHFACISPLAMSGLRLKLDSIIINQELPCLLSLPGNVS